MSEWGPCPKCGTTIENLCACTNPKCEDFPWPSPSPQDERIDAGDDEDGAPHTLHVLHKCDGNHALSQLCLDRQCWQGTENPVVALGNVVREDLISARIIQAENAQGEQRHGIARDTLFIEDRCTAVLTKFNLLT